MVRRVVRIESISVLKGSGLALVEFADDSSALIEAGFGLRQLFAALGGDPIGKIVEIDVNEGGVIVSIAPMEADT